MKSLSRENFKEPYVKASKHEFIMPGVVADNDEGYIKRQYKYKWGDGVGKTKRDKGTKIMDLTDAGGFPIAIDAKQVPALMK
jgi:hypothetical protein